MADTLEKSFPDADTLAETSDYSGKIGLSTFNSIASSRLSVGLAALAMVAGLNCSSTLKKTTPRHFAFQPTTTMPPVSCPRAVDPENLTAEVKNLHNGSVFKTLRENCVFEQNDMWAVTANSETFSRMGEAMATNSPEVQNLLDKEQINVLYPGAGVHLASLDLLFQLADKSNNLQKINITYTDVNPVVYKGIDKQLQRLDMALNAIYGLQIAGETPDDKPKTKTIRFNYQNQNGRPVEFRINYEYRMSGERFFRAQSLADADLIINHDIDAGVEYQSEGHHAISEYLSSYDFEWSKKKHLLLIENRPQTFVLGNYLETMDMPYGCGENHFADKPGQNRDRGVALIELDTDRMEVVRQQLEKIYPGQSQRAWALFTHLSSGQRKVYDPDDIYAAWLGVRLYRETPDPGIKILAKKLLEELIEVPFSDPKLNINLDTDDIGTIKEKIQVFFEDMFVKKPSVQ